MHTLPYYTIRPYCSTVDCIIIDAEVQFMESQCDVAKSTAGICSNLTICKNLCVYGHHQYDCVIQSVYISLHCSVC